MSNYDDETREWFVGTANPVEVRLLGEMPHYGIITSWNEIGILLVGQAMEFIPWTRVVRISIPDPASEQARVEGNIEAKRLAGRSRKT